MENVRNGFKIIRKRPLELFEARHFWPESGVPPPKGNNYVSFKDLIWPVFTPSDTRRTSLSFALNIWGCTNVQTSMLFASVFKVMRSTGCIRTSQLSTLVIRIIGEIYGYQSVYKILETINKNPVVACIMLMRDFIIIYRHIDMLCSTSEGRDNEAQPSTSYSVLLLPKEKRKKTPSVVGVHKKKKRNKKSRRSVKAKTKKRSSIFIKQLETPRLTERSWSDSPPYMKRVACSRTASDVWESIENDRPSFIEMISNTASALAAAKRDVFDARFQTAMKLLTITYGHGSETRILRAIDYDSSKATHMLFGDLIALCKKYEAQLRENIF